jgi:hypothetical protein
MDALTMELPALMEDRRKELLQNVDAAELERMEAELPRLIARMREPQGKELLADDQARKAGVCGTSSRI